MNLFEKLRTRAIQLEAYAHDLVQDLAEVADIVDGLSQLQNLVLSRPDLLPGILSYANSLVAATVTTPSGKALPAVTKNAVRTVAQGTQPDFKEHNTTEGLPDGDGGAPDGDGSDGVVDLPPGDFFVRRRAAGASAVSPLAPAEGNVNGAASDQPPSPGAVAAPHRADLSGFGLGKRAGLHSFNYDALSPQHLNRELELADLQRPFIEAAAGKAQALMRTPAAVSAAHEAATLDAVSEYETADAEVKTAVHQATAASDPHGVEPAGLADGRMAGSSMAAGDAVESGAQAAAITLTPCADEMAAASPASGAADEAEAGTIRRCAAPPVEDAVMEDAAGYHTPRTRNDRGCMLDSPQTPLHGLQPGQRQLVDGQLEQVRLQLQEGEEEPEAHEAKDNAAAEEEETEEECVDTDVEKCEMYSYGNPVQGYCSNWPNTRTRADKEEWENEFKHHVRVLEADGSVKYRYSHKNSRREMLKFFLCNVDGRLSADGPALDGEDGDGGSKDVPFFAMKPAVGTRGATGSTSAMDAAGFVDDGLDQEQEEYDDSAYLSEIRHPEEDAPDDEFMSDGSADDAELEGDEEGLLGATQGPGDEEEDLSESAEADEPKPLFASRKRRPAEGASAGAVREAADSSPSAGPGRRKQSAPGRRGLGSGSHVATTTSAPEPGDQKGCAMARAGFSSSTLSSGVRAMLREVVRKSMFSANSIMSTEDRIEAKYTRAALEHMMGTLLREVDRIKAEWHQSKRKLKLQAQAVHWWQLSRKVVTSALVAAQASVGLGTDRTHGDVWLEEVGHLKERVMSLCRKVAPTYVDSMDSFGKELKKYAALLEPTVHAAEERCVKLHAASTTQEEAQVLQKKARRELRALWPEGEEQSRAQRLKSKKGLVVEGAACDAGCGALGSGGTPAAGSRAAGSDGEADGEADGDGSYESSFIDDDDAEEWGQEVAGMERQCDANEAADGSNRRHGKLKLKSSGKDSCSAGREGVDIDMEDAAAEQDGVEEDEGAPAGPNAVVGLAPNQTEVLFGYNVREKKAAKEQSIKKAQEQVSDALAQQLEEANAGSAEAGEAPAVILELNDTAPGAGAAGGDCPREAMDLDSAPAGSNGVAAARVQGCAEDVVGVGEGADLVEGDAAGMSVWQAPGDEVRAGELAAVQQEPATPRADDIEEDVDVQVTATVQVSQSRGRRASGSTTTPMATPHGAASTPAINKAAIGVEANLRTLGPQSLELNGAVDIMLGAEPKTCRSMYRAWQTGGRIVDILGEDMYSVAVEEGCPPQQVPAASLRPTQADDLRTRAGCQALHRGALLQVRELNANGTAVWKPVLVVAVVRAYSSAAAVSWRELRKQLPGRIGMRPSWERSGDWTWVAKGSQDAAGPLTDTPAAGHTPATAPPCDVTGAAANAGRSASGGVMDATSRKAYGNTSDVDSLPAAWATGRAASEAKPLYVRLLYIHEYMHNDRNLDKLVDQVSVEHLLHKRGAMPLLWWNPRRGKMMGVWHVVESDPGLKRTEMEIFNRVTDARFLQQFKGTQVASKQHHTRELATSSAGADAEPELAQQQLQRVRQTDEASHQSRMVRIVARRLRTRFYADVPRTRKLVGQLRTCLIKSKRGKQDDGNGTKPGKRKSRCQLKRTPGLELAEGDVQEVQEAARRGTKRKLDDVIVLDGDDQEPGKAPEAGGVIDSASDSSIGIPMPSSGDEDNARVEIDEGQQTAGRGGRGRGGRGVMAAGRSPAGKRPRLEDSSARAMMQQKQILKQREEMRKLRQQALAKRQAHGGEVQGGDKGSRPLFDSRPLPTIAACFARRLKAHQVQGLRFMWENLVDNYSLDVLQSSESDAAGGCILAHSMGLGKTLSTISFLHMFLGQAMSSTSPDSSCEATNADGLQGRRRAVLVVPSNVLYNFYTEFMVWLPERGSADEALSRLTGKKVYLLQNEDDLVDKWFAEEGSVLLMSSRKFINMVLVPMGKGAPKRRGKSHGIWTQYALDERVDGGEGAGGDHTVEVETAAATARRLRQQELRTMLVEGCSLVVVDEAHELRNPESQLYKAMCSLTTRRRLALTGYPLQNNLEEYYTMLTWVQGDLLGDPRSFKFEFALPIKKGQQANASCGERMASNKRLVVLDEITADFIHRAGPEILERELPPKSEVVLLLDLNDRQREYYEAYLKELEGLPNSTDRYRLFRDFEVLRKVMNNPRDFEGLLAKAVAGGGMSIIQAEGCEGVDDDIQFQVTPVEQNDHRGGHVMRSGTSAGPWGATSTADPGGEAGGDAVARDNNRKSSVDVDDPLDAHSPMAGTSGAGAGADVTPAPVASGIDGLGGAKASCKTHKGKQTLQLPLELCERLHKRLVEQREALKAGAEGASEEEVDPLWGLLPKQAFVEQLLRVCQAKTEKLVIFSQSLHMLDSLEATLLRRFRYRSGVEFFRIDGAVLSKQRHHIIDKFNKSEESRVILVSSRAGSLGINLTTASRLILLDVPWNPVFNAQAIARIYRFGQTRPTFVYRLLYAATLEELVYDLNVDKEELFNKVVDKKLVRKAQPAAGERWTYTAPTRMAAEVARRRLEELADPTTAAAALAAATAASVPQRSSAGTTATVASAATTTAVASGSASLAIDVKDYALLDLSQRPEVQGCLVNAYLHKSKLPPDPLGDLTAEDKISARQQYQAEVGGDGVRRLRRLRRMAQDPVGSSAAAGTGGMSVQAAGCCPTPEVGHRGPGEDAQLCKVSSTPHMNPTGVSAGPGTVTGATTATRAVDDVDPALQDWTTEEEAARQLAEHQYRDRQQKHIHREHHQQPQRKPHMSQQPQPKPQQPQQQQQRNHHRDADAEHRSFLSPSIPQSAPSLLSSGTQHARSTLVLAGGLAEANAAPEQSPPLRAAWRASATSPRQWKQAAQWRTPERLPCRPHVRHQLPHMELPACVPVGMPATAKTQARASFFDIKGSPPLAAPLPDSLLSSGGQHTAPPRQTQPPDCPRQQVVGPNVQAQRQKLREAFASRSGPQGPVVAPVAAESSAAHREPAAASSRRARLNDSSPTQGMNDASKRQRNAQQNAAPQRLTGPTPPPGSAPASDPAAANGLEASQPALWHPVNSPAAAVACPVNTGGSAQKPHRPRQAENGDRSAAAAAAGVGPQAAPVDQLRTPRHAVRVRPGSLNGLLRGPQATPDSGGNHRRAVRSCRVKSEGRQGATDNTGNLETAGAFLAPQVPEVIDLASDDDDD